MRQVDIVYGLTKEGPAWDVTLQAGDESYLVRTSAPDAVAASLKASYGLQTCRSVVAHATDTKPVDWEAVVDSYFAAIEDGET